MRLNKTRLLNPKFTTIILLVLLSGVTLAYAQHSSLVKIDTIDRLKITEKAEVIKNVNVSDRLEISEKTDLFLNTSQDSK
ncbi:MAG TPA: hypothetical protein VLD38_05845 [Nitrosopumilaceae archaeon]|nr:hypothetical protein [Nitrosopumilaceae archaeon]